MADVVLGAVGATVGFIAGGPLGASIGWAIGSTAGSMYAASRQTIRGPSIGDVAQQIATEGAPIPIVFGRSPPIMGTVVADQEPYIRKTKKRTGGKGSPKVETEEAFRTYAIMICEGPATLLQAWRDGRLVYDAEADSSDSSMAEDNAAFMEYARWIPGTHAQVPHPVLEEIYGVGNAPAFRGRCVCLFEQEDVTDKRGARSQWHFRVFRGAGVTYHTTPPYAAFAIDMLDVLSTPVDGVHKSVIAEYAARSDDLEVGSTALDGIHQEWGYRYGPESLDASSIPLDGTHREYLYKYGPESLDISSVPQDGTHKEIVLLYNNYEPEPVDLTSTPLNGTHGVV